MAGDDPPWVGELTGVARRMSGVLLAHETVDTVLRLITTLAVEAIPGSTGAGVTLTDARGQPTSAAATDSLVERADVLQYELNEGPCLAAIATRTPQRVHDLAAEQRWPRWAAKAQEIGLGATLSAPLFAGDLCLGAMKVYADRAGAFEERAEQLLGLLAAPAAVLVANVQCQQDARRMSENLRTALGHRDVIALAKGTLMHSRNVDEQGAFAILAAASARQNLPLHDVARELVLATTRRRS
ncbi:MAG TPA: GAF and ANTAR domain-containing protein [Nocardioides sp.]|nr:GAF and ANTAR domain-containing protein [Nocardioides sp.]